MELEFEFKPKTRSDLLSKELPDGSIIYDPKTETIHSLNSSGSFIWYLCDGNHTVKDIIEIIKHSFQTFEVSPEEAVLNTIKLFIEKNLLENQNAFVS